MAMNASAGVGITISAKDQATKTFRSVRSSWAGFRNEFKKRTTIQDPMMRGIATGAIGAGMLKFGKGMTGFFRGAFDESRAFQKGIAEVSTLVSELDFPRDKMEEMAKSMASTYGADANEQAKALYQTISAGYGTVESASKMMAAANKLAIGGVTTTSVAVDGLTTVVNAYAKDNVTAAQTSDAMFVAIKAGKTTAEELSGSIGRLAPTTVAANISMEEMLASVAAITTQGLQTSEAISGMRAAMANIIKPSKDARDEAARLGIEFDSSAVRSKGLKGVLDSITTSAGFNETSFEKLFGGMEGLNAIMALSANGGQKFAEVLDLMKDSSGATDEAFNKMAGTADFQLKRLTAIRANIQKTIGKTVGDIFAPVLPVFVRLTTAVDEFVTSLPPGARKMLIGVATAITAIAVAMGGLMIASGIMKAFGVSIIGVAFSAAKIAVVFALLLPLVAGLGIGFYALYRAATKNGEGFGITMKNWKEKLQLAWTGMIQIVKDGKLSEEMIKELGKAENKGVLRFIRGFERFKERFGAFWRGIKDGFAIGVEDLSRSPAFARLRASFGRLMDLFIGKDSTNSQKELDNWASRGKEAGIKLAGLGETAATVATRISDFVTSTMESFGQWSADDFASGIRTAVDAFNELWYILNIIQTTFSAMYHSIKLALSMLLEFLINITDLSTGMWFVDKRMPKMFTSKGWEWTNQAGAELGDVFVKEKERQSDVELGERVAKDRSFQRRQADQFLARQTEIKHWIETPAEQWTATPMAFSEAPAATQAQFREEFERLGKKIEILGKRPLQINVDLDGKKVGSGVEDAAGDEDKRNLGASPRGKTFGAYVPVAAGR